MVAARVAVAVTELGASTFVVLVSNGMVALFANVCGTVVSSSAALVCTTNMAVGSGSLPTAGVWAVSRARVNE